MVETTRCKHKTEQGGTTRDEKTIYRRADDTARGIRRAAENGDRGDSLTRMAKDSAPRWEMSRRERTHRQKVDQGARQGQLAGRLGNDRGRRAQDDLEVWLSR